MYKKLLAIISFTTLTPLVSFAATKCSTLPKDTFSDIVSKFVCITNVTIIPTLISIAFLIMVIGIVRFMSHGDNEEDRKKGKDFIIWGLISMTMIFTIWGFVRIFVNTLGLDTTSEFTIPEAPSYTP
ncbi:MAG: hypothetical protein KBB88_01805 [Candidatus Pacebacteria bacterium]|nr:hypothetical protein [Candidatus Paceibacterota bacterium]